jgi:hypothetical protein
VETLCDRDVCRGGRHAGEGFAFERVGRRGDVEVVLVAAAGDVDVGLGAGGGGVDAAGRDVSGRALDGVS